MIVKIEQIRTGERHRKDYGDLSALAESIEVEGLLQPIGITPEYELVFGERRLLAVRDILNSDEIEVRIVNVSSIIAGEYAENEIRKAFTPEERVYIGKALEEEIKRPAHRPRKDEKIHPYAGEKTLQVAARQSGFGNDRTYRQAKEIVEAAEENPEEFGPVLEQMNRTGKVGGAYRKLRMSRDEQRILSIQPIKAKFRTLVVDPPWDHEGLSLAGRGIPGYAVMSLDELLKMDVVQWAEDECHLYLWTTNNFLLEAGKLIEPWGFRYKTVLTGVKNRFGLGSYFRSSTEQVLFAVRGKMTTRVDNIPTHFDFPRGEHSAKPEEFYDIVRRASYPPYGEIFQREPRADFTNVFQEIEDSESVSYG